MMGLVGIAGIAAITGGAIYIYVTVGSLLFGKKLEAGATSANFTPIPAQRTDGGRADCGSATAGSRHRAPSCSRWCSWSPSSCTTSSTGSTSRRSGA